jgi:hypothetical protein
MKLPNWLESFPAGVSKAHIGARAARTTGALWLTVIGCCEPRAPSRKSVHFRGLGWLQKGVHFQSRESQQFNPG